MTLARAILANTICLAATGCAVGPSPDRSHLGAPPPASYVNAPGRVDAQTETSDMLRWWHQIEDPGFRDSVGILLSANLDLHEAQERVVQARERLNIQRGGNFPIVTADADGSRNFVTDQAGERNYLNALSANLNISWTVDLFGRRKRGIQSSRATYLSATAEHEALSHVLIAELVNRHVAIAVNSRRLALAQENAANRELLHRIVQRRYNLGTSGTALSDVHLAEANLATVQADVPQFQRLLAEEVYRLDVLLGRAPGSSEVEASQFPLLTLPSAPPVSIPAALLDRRPDLRASELRVQAATANIGVAIADLYPQLTLGGSVGVAGSSTTNLFSSEQLAGSLLGSISQRLFAGGALRANVRLQESIARELSASYAQDVLEAVREVEAALKAGAELDRQHAIQTRTVQALRAAETASETRYRSGLLTLQDLLDTQQRCYLAEQNWLLTQQLRWSTRISLYLALGGDWTDAEVERTN